jgi:Domain of unknown function (DUF927)
MRQKTTSIQIKKVARVRDKATSDYFEIIEFPVSDNERSRLELPPSVVADPTALEKRLRDAGAILPKKNVREFLRAVGGRKAPLELVYEAQTGWTEDRKLFVLADGAIGATNQRILGINQRSGANDASGRLSAAGTWKSWRATVGNPAHQILVSAFVVALSCHFKEQRHRLGPAMPEYFQVISQLLVRELFHTRSTPSNCRKFRGAGTPCRAGGL